MELHRHYRSHQFQLKCALETVLSAGLWPAARVHEIHPEVSPICPRCSSAVETCKHTFWECPCNSDIDDYAVVSTQNLCAKALANADSLPCFWLRGIIPQELTKVEDSYAPPDEPNHTIISNIGEAVWSSGTYYGDASGGEFSSLPAIRRVGCSVVFINTQGDLLFGIKSRLPGQIQTVPRGELYCLLMLAQQVTPLATVDFVTDNLGVCNAFNKGPEFCAYVNNCDLFKSLFKHIYDKALRFSVRWVPSHL